MYIDTTEIVRVRIETDEFHDDEPGPPKAAEGGVMVAKTERRRPPYSIIVRFFLSLDLPFFCLVRFFFGGGRSSSFSSLHHDVDHVAANFFFVYIIHQCSLP